MLNNFKFANVNAKIKGMYAKFLNKDDYQELIKQESMNQLIILLKSKIKSLENIDDNSKRQQIEQELYILLLEDVEKIYPLLKKREQELLEKYLEKLKLKDQNYIEEKNEFYKQYYYILFKNVEKYKDKELIDIVGKQIDLYNILWNIRAKKYKDLAENYEIPIHYKFSKEYLEKIKIEQVQIEDVMQKTVYNQLNLEENIIEKEIQEYLYKLYINYFKTKSFSLTMIIAYLELRQVQIRNIITIVEGVRYKVELR